MLLRTAMNLAVDLAVGLVMLFGGLQMWWAIEALQQVRRVDAAGERPAVSQLMAASPDSLR